jgi:hypothetical protein
MLNYYFNSFSFPFLKISSMSLFFLRALVSLFPAQRTQVLPHETSKIIFPCPCLDLQASFLCLVFDVVSEGVCQPLVSIRLGSAASLTSFPRCLCLNIFIAQRQNIFAPNYSKDKSVYNRKYRWNSRFLFQIIMRNVKLKISIRSYRFQLRNPSSSYVTKS